MVKNKTIEKAREARTTAVILTQPKSLEEILKSFHDCRDCDYCFQMLGNWHCELDVDAPYEETIVFKHHYITPCEKFKQKDK